MLDHEMFKQLLERVEIEIRAEMESIVEFWKADNETVSDNDYSGGEVGLKEIETEVREGDEGFYDKENERENEGPVVKIVISAEAVVDDRPVLTVGIFCARGQHR